MQGRGEGWRQRWGWGLLPFLQTLGTIGRVLVSSIQPLHLKGKRTLTFPGGGMPPSAADFQEGVSEVWWFCPKRQFCPWHREVDRGARAAPWISTELKRGVQKGDGSDYPWFPRVGHKRRCSACLPLSWITCSGESQPPYCEDTEAAPWEA